MVVRDVVGERFAGISGIPQQLVDPDANLFEVYALDSVKALKLISDIEVTFDIDIDEDEARGIRNLNDVIRLIESKRN